MRPQRFAHVLGFSVLGAILCSPPLKAQTAWTTRSFDSARTSANTRETVLTPQKVGSNLMLKLFSLNFNDDPRLEAQPLYVPGITMNDGKVHDVVYVATMANNVWAFDANNGKPIWNSPVSLGRPIKPRPTAANPIVDSQASPCHAVQIPTEIDMWGINLLWGVLSTPVIDLDTKTMYVVNWTSPDGSVAKAFYQLHALDLTDGHEIQGVTIEATADAQTMPGQPPITFVPGKQKQRPGLLLVPQGGTGGTPARKTLIVAFGMTHEENDLSHGWLIAYDTSPLRRTAAWVTTPKGTGSGIWQAAQGPAADENGDIYVMTGNYGVENAQGLSLPPVAGDVPESFVKLHYTPPANARDAGKLEAVAWFSPFRDSDRNKNGEDNFQDYDLGSGGPVPIPGMNLVVGAGKDGVLYVLSKDTAGFGKGSDLSKLKQPPIFFTYFPGFGIDPAIVQNLDHLFDGKTHHLHGSPAFWKNPTLGPMLFVWGENESLRAWTIDANGKATFVARSAEVASAGAAGRGGMPGGFPVVSSNGNIPNTGIVWATAPLSDDANRFVVEGILRAYDATVLDPVKNPDGTPRLKLLWDSKHIPGNTFCLSKFCPPVVADGKVFVPTYGGRVDVYGLVQIPRSGPLPANADRVPEPPR